MSKAMKSIHTFHNRNILHLPRILQRTAWARAQMQKIAWPFGEIQILRGPEKAQECWGSLLFYGCMFYIHKFTVESFRAMTCHILTIYISNKLTSLSCECTYSVVYSRRNNWQNLRMVCLSFASSNFKSYLGKILKCSSGTMNLPYKVSRKDSSKALIRRAFTTVSKWV